MTDYEPIRHYSSSSFRPDYTPCGKWKADVVVTSFPEQVTCPTCVAELDLQITRPVSR